VCPLGRLQDLTAGRGGSDAANRERPGLGRAVPGEIPIERCRHTRPAPNHLAAVDLFFNPARPFLREHQRSMPVSSLDNTALKEHTNDIKGNGIQYALIDHG
jgi:hypothetical protein